MSSPDFYRSLFESLPDPAWVTRDGVLLLVNPAVVRLFGADSAAQLIGTTVFERVHPEYREVARARQRGFDDGGTEAPRIEMTFVALDGRVIEGEIEATRVMFNGEPAVFAVMRDISERRRAAQALAASEERLRLALEATSDGVWDLDLTTNTIYCSPRWYAILGLTPIESPVPIDFVRALYHPDDAQRIIDSTRRAITDGGNFDIEARLRCADGSYKWIMSRGSVSVRDANGVATRLSGINTDINERRLAEDAAELLQAELQQSQKMESLGRLAGGIAHDFNNMLGVIMGHADLAIGSLGPNDRAVDDLLEIKKAAERSAALTRQLLTYARRQLSIPAELDLNVLIENVVGMLRRLIGTHISMVWTPGAELWTVRMDPVQFDQLLTNLCVNARDAIDDTGTVRVATANVVIDEAFTARHSGARTGEFVRVTVSDDGSGIDATTLAHIFEPFFTTKPVGVGTGLGLSMVVGIVAQNNGFITVDSAIGQGTTFAIHLPRYVGDAASQQARGTSAPSTPGAETILVVEDEPAILSLVVRTLSGLGYKVLGANGPRHALTISAEHDGVIDLMLTDVKMPDMNGRDLSVALQKDRPDMRVLFMSGYPAEVIAKRGVLDEGLQFLAKPFLVKDLVGKIREILK